MADSMATSNGGIASVLVQTAEELIHELSPMNPRWQDPYHNPRSWIFRGQWDSEWPLLPSAYRPNAWDLFTDRSEMSLIGRDRENLAALTLLEFARRLDELGMALPGEHDVLYEHFTALTHARLCTPMKGRRLWPFVALAQHSGIPTALLDWTRVAYHAAYFAAASNTPSASTKRVAVWAISEALLDTVERMKEPPCCRVTAPRWTNPNLRAQAGLFTIWYTAQYRVPLDAVLEAAVKVDTIASLHSTFASGRGKRLIYRFELPQRESRRLLNILSFHGVDGARLFPGYEGAVRAMREQGFDHVALVSEQGMIDMG
jgi:hypothetical protein